ncbi:MAG TPA: DUF6799 domain-containing protein, partial [Flavipsychrobacter sp.]|nr:DUF6799 domain-containing protein [Flavipsychrobacter sp.]
MKKLLLAALAFIFFIAQADAQDKDKMKDGVKMKNGKVWAIKDGKKSEATREITLNDGSKVMTDGSVVMTDGTVKKLSDGDMVTMDGKWMDRDKKDKEDKNGKMDKDRND